MEPHPKTFYRKASRLRSCTISFFVTMRCLGGASRPIWSTAQKPGTVVCLGGPPSLPPTLLTPTLGCLLGFCLDWGDIKQDVRFLPCHQQLFIFSTSGLQGERESFCGSLSPCHSWVKIAGPLPGCFLVTPPLPPQRALRQAPESSSSLRLWETPSFPFHDVSPEHELFFAFFGVE